jgi:hypothetical protein
MGNFYTDVIQKHPDFNSLMNVRDLALLEPATRDAVQMIQSDARGMGINLLITETYRSRARQSLLFRQGATQLETVGVHHYGLAADFCKLIGGQASWAGDWSFLRDLAEKHGMISGLDWGSHGVRHGFVDPDHVQRVKVDQQPELFAGRWYPGEVVS